METVRQISLALGAGDRSLTQADIDAFEALDITAEWDSSALCAGLLLLEAWRLDPGAGLPVRPPLLPRPRDDVPWPDLQGFLADVGARPGHDPVRSAREALLARLDGYGASQRATIETLLRDSRTLERSLTFWLVQVFNLGSRRFSEVYGLDPQLETPSLLETFDRPMLSADEVTSLLSWLKAGRRGAALVTNRPATSPSGVFNTPEAEIGARVSGLGSLPVAAAGDLGHRAVSLGLDPQAFLKPNPVHLLAGILLAAGRSRESCFEAAVDLGHRGLLHPMWREIGSLRVVLFEDAAKGIQGLQAAAELLRREGVSMETDPVGVASGPPKSRALERSGARVYPDIRRALDAVVPDWRDGR